MNVLNDFSMQKSAQTSNQMQVKKEEQPVKKETIPEKPVENKPDALDIFCKKVVNKKDINDMVTVPRSIFKGYLYFTAGTALNAIGAMMDKTTKSSKAMNILGSVMAIIGTFNFVKPFITKGGELTKNEK